MSLNLIFLDKINYYFYIIKIRKYLSGKYEFSNSENLVPNSSKILVYIGLRIRCYGGKLHACVILDVEIWITYRFYSINLSSEKKYNNILVIMIYRNRKMYVNN